MPERQGARRQAIREPFLDRVGKETLGLLASVGDMLGFVGEAVLAQGHSCAAGPASAGLSS